MKFLGSHTHSSVGECVACVTLRQAGSVQGKAQKKTGALVGAPPHLQDSVEATVFVRGLPLDTLQYELQDRMSRFGKLKACR